MGYATASTYLNSTPRTPTDAHRILLEAEQQWREEERWNLNESANLGYPEMKALTSREAAPLAVDPDSVNSGASFVVPYTDQSSIKTETVKLTVNPEELAMLRRGIVYPFTDRQAFGPHVTGVEIVSLPKVRAPRAQTTEGKVVTEYVIFSQGSKVGTASSMAEAREKGIEMMKKSETLTKLTVEARVKRASGDVALINITRPVPDESTVTFKVTKDIPKAGATVNGYLVLFSTHF